MHWICNALCSSFLPYLIGDYDLVVGEFDGDLNFFENTGSASAAVYTERTGPGNPVDGVDVGRRSAPTLADLDNDGQSRVMSCNGSTCSHLSYLR